MTARRPAAARALAAGLGAFAVAGLGAFAVAGLGAFAVAGLGAFAGAALAQTVEERLNDYPTEARADYVFGCMAANGQSRTSLRACACSIDVIASIVPYEQYVEAETVLSLRQTGGERMAIFRSSALANNLVADLRRAQAEAEIRCF